MYGTDALSRMQLFKCRIPAVVFLEINSLHAFSLHDSFLQRVSRTYDPVIKRLKFFIINGWPVHIPLLPFFKLDDEYTMQSGIVYRGCRIVPLYLMRNTILQQMHNCHPGNGQINARKRANVRLTSWEDAEDFFERIHIDVAFYRNHTILVIIDAFFRWVDAHFSNDLSARAAV